MEPPEGSNIPTNMVCKLNKSIYGLKQAARSWNETVNNVLSELKFVRSEYDHCLYTTGQKFPDTIQIMHTFIIILLLLNLVQFFNNIISLIKYKNQIDTIDTSFYAIFA